VFEGIEEINGQALSDKVLTGTRNCFACPIACGRGTEIKDGPWEGHEGEGPEYETVNVFGGMCYVADMNAVTMANFLCNEYGLDAISTGSSIAFSMECYEKGILTKEMTGGLELNFGDGALLVDLVEKIGRREGIGDFIAEGTKRMSEKLGHGSEAFAMHVKGLELPAYDPRAAKICGLGYALANRGGCHMAGYVQGPTFIDTPWLLVDDSKIEDVFVANPKEAKVLVDLENALTLFDCIGGCKFMGFLLPAQEYADLIAAATGWNFTVEEFRKGGERIYNLARSYCVREGISRKDDILPKRLYDDPLPDGPAKGMVIERDTLEAMKDAYYEFRKWDKETGKPSIERLNELGLEFLLKDVWPTGK
jgi:aldehyde:ferredoxin oxidoreductase